MPAQTETIPAWKEEEIAKLEALIEDVETVGIVNIAGIPSRQLQTMRSDLREIAALRVSRNTLVSRALESVDEGLEDLVEYVSGPVGLVLTDENPFTLFRHLEASKTPAPIGAGEVAPNDIVIEAGDTGIDPGPFVGELQNVGAPARIDEGSIKVTETATVCEAGEVVSEELAGVLNELELEPKEVGLDLQAVFADGVVFLSEELELDIDEYRDQFAAGAGTAMGLAVEVAYPAAGAIDALLSKAHAGATQTAVRSGFVEPGVADAVLAAAAADGRSIAGQIDDEEAVPSDIAPSAPTPASTEDDQEEQATQPDEADDSETDEVDDDDEDEDVSGEGLGDLFG